MSPRKYLFGKAITIETINKMTEKYTKTKSTYPRAPTTFSEGSFGGFQGINTFLEGSWSPTVSTHSHLKNKIMSIQKPRLIGLVQAPAEPISPVEPWVSVLKGMT